MFFLNDSGKLSLQQSSRELIGGQARQRQAQAIQEQEDARPFDIQKFKQNSNKNLHNYHYGLFKPVSSLPLFGLEDGACPVGGSGVQMYANNATRSF